MTHVHLPAEHSDADLALAGAVAETLESAELYVAWSQTTGSGRPIVPAAVRSEPAPEPRARLTPLPALLVELRRRLRRPR